MVFVAKIGVGEHLRESDDKQEDGGKGRKGAPFFMNEAINVFKKIIDGEKEDEERKDDGEDISRIDEENVER